MKTIERISQMAYDNKRYYELYMKFLIVVLFLGVPGVLIIDTFEILSLIYRWFFGLIIIAVVVKLLIEIILNTDNEMKYKFVFTWSIACVFFVVFLSKILIEIEFIISSLNFLSLILMFHSGLNYFILKKVNHWFKYSSLFIISPIIAMSFWLFYCTLLFDLTGKNFFMSNQFFGWGILILAILIINYIILISPTSQKQMSELKVAIYFVLAIFSTLSYISFLSGDLAQIIKNVNVNSEQVENIKALIDELFRWGSLPYLIGMVFACFSIELKQRNYDIKLANDKNQEE